MSLKALLRAGKELLKAKKPSATPTTGEQTRQITYTPKPSQAQACLLYTSPSPRDGLLSRMPSSA